MKALHLFVPQIFINWAVWAVRPISGFTGSYTTWSEAQEKCAGYESQNIVSFYATKFREFATSSPTVLESSHARGLISQRKVRVLAAFGQIHQRSGMAIKSVMDFGGAFASDYWEIGTLLEKLETWQVIESPRVAKRLSEEAAMQPQLQNKLCFSSSIPEQEFDAVYSSGTIQCLADGLSLIDDFAAVSKYVVLDRVPVVEMARSKIMIQKTSKLFGGVGSSYPVWFFSRSDFNSALDGKWKVLLSWEVPEDSPHVEGKRRAYSGYLLERL